MKPDSGIKKGPGRKITGAFREMKGLPLTQGGARFIQLEPDSALIWTTLLEPDSAKYLPKSTGESLNQNR